MSGIAPAPAQFGRRHTDRGGTAIGAAAMAAMMTLTRLQRFGIGILLLSINAEGKTVIHITEPPANADQLIRSAHCQLGMCIAHLGGAEIRWFQDVQPASQPTEEKS